jgi:hypothetical protein
MKNVHVVLEKKSVQQHSNVPTFVTPHSYSVTCTTLASVQDMEKCSIMIALHVNAQEANISTQLIGVVIASVQWENTLIL